MSPSAIDVEQLKRDLNASTSARRRKAALQVGSQQVVELAPELHAALTCERVDPRTWETQLIMVRVLGQLRFRPALHLITEIVEANKEHDMITIEAACAFCRIRRSSSDDALPVVEVMKFAAFSVATGAFLSLGCDRVVPPYDEITSVLSYAAKWHHEKGYGDPRYGVTVAAAGWKHPDVRPFLESCLASGDSGVVAAASSSLKGRYVRCR